MFELVIGLAIAEMKMREEEYFYKSLGSAPAEIRSALIQAREDKKEKQRLEAIAERRHREQVDAIRSLKRYDY